MHRQQLLGLLENYRTRFMDEAAMVQRTRDFVREHANCFDRSLLHGHVTGSAWVVNPTFSHALMMHHRKLDRWLQPGGHADGDADIVRVAMREIAEEAGVDSRHIRLVSETPFDVDIHIVYPTATDPRHEHYDIRFLLELDDCVPLCGNDESHEVLWVPLSEVLRLNNDRSVYRMREKTRDLRRGG